MCKLNKLKPKLDWLLHKCEAAAWTGSARYDNHIVSEALAYFTRTSNTSIVDKDDKDATTDPRYETNGPDNCINVFHG